MLKVKPHTVRSVPFSSLSAAVVCRNANHSVVYMRSERCVSIDRAYTFSLHWYW